MLEKQIVIFNIVNKKKNQAFALLYLVTYNQRLMKVFTKYKNKLRKFEYQHFVNPNETVDLGNNYHGC